MSALELGVLLAPAVLDTPAFVAGAIETDVWGTETFLSRLPEEVPWPSGQELAVTAMVDSGTPRHELVLVELGVSGEIARFRPGSFEMRPVMVDARVDVGMLGWFDTRHEVPPRVDGYVDFGFGARGSFLSMAPLVTAFAPSPHGFVGLGVASRTRGPRVRAEVRGEVAPRFDQLEGRAEQAEGAVAWTWFPGSAAVSLVVGVSAPTRGRAPQPPSTAAASPAE